MSDRLDRLVAALRAGAPGVGDRLYEVYRELREAEPLYRCPWGDWYVSSLDPASRLLAGRLTMRRGEFAVATTDTGSDAAVTQCMLRRWLLCLDDAEHRALRGRLSAPFTAARIEMLRPLIADMARRLLDRWLQEPDRDLVEALAQPLPIMVICRLLGLPHEALPLVTRWTRALRLAVDYDDEPSQAAAAAAVSEMSAYLAEVTKAAVESDAETHQTGLDYASLLDHHGEEAVVSNLAFLLFAGNETTAHLLSSMFLLLAQRPEIWWQLGREPARRKEAVTEVLRYESPVQKISMRAAEPMVMAGRRIVGGDVLVVLVGAVNRDPAALDAPDHFRIDRPPVANLAFGGGPHTCLGRRLAQLEAEVVLEEAAARLEEIAVSNWSWLPMTTFRGLEQLHLQVRPSANPRRG